MPTTPREVVTLVIVSVLLCGGLVWMAGQFPKVSRSHVQEYAPTTTAAPVAAQQPPTATAPASSAPQQHRLAPSGVLYPIEYVSSTTKDGVIGFLPGRPLRVVEDKGDTIVVSDGKKKGEVSADKLTNDLDIAALAAQQDAEGQQVLTDYLKSRRAVQEAFLARQNVAFDRALPWIVDRGMKGVLSRCVVGSTTRSIQNRDLLLPTCTTVTVDTRFTRSGPLQALRSESKKRRS